MIIYSLTYILALFSLLFDKIDKKKGKLLFFILGLLLVIIAGSKDANTCPDTENYIRSYESARSLSELKEIEIFYYEPGYELLMSLGKALNLDYTAFFYIIALITISIYCYCFWRYSPKPFLSLFIFISISYITQVVVIIRYGLATAIVFYAIVNYYRTGNLLRFVVASLAASLFHYTALSVFVLFPFLFFHFRRVTFLRLLVIAFALSIFNITLLTLAQKYIGIMPSYISYAISKGLQYVDEQGEGSLTQVILLIPFFYMIIKKMVVDNGERVKFERLFTLLILCVFLKIEFTQAAELSRISTMYMSTLYLIIPLLLNNLDKKDSNLLYMYTIIYCIARFIRISYFNSGLQIYVI